MKGSEKSACAHKIHRWPVPAVVLLFFLSLPAFAWAAGNQGVVTVTGYAVNQSRDTTAPAKAVLVAARDTAAGGVEYTVCPGDTLYRIGLRYGVSYEAIMEANGLTSTLIYPGQVLSIPAKGEGAPARPAPQEPAVSRAGGADERGILAKAVSLLGKPYAFGASGPSSFDCSGFTAYVFRQVAGINLPHNAAAQAELGRPVSRDRLSPGDLVFFGYYGGRGIGHVGIYVGEGRFIHASTNRGVTYSSLSDTYYANNYKGARRIIR
ncbi:MAG: C40 family peptidase [Thermoanaerobacteraceae bacterium]|nr:C40 family peptidase [Thermoanaerobacteraceae bacterium]